VTLEDTMNIAVSGILAQRTRLTVTASNLANAETTRTAQGGPYQRRDPVFEAEPVAGSFGDRLQRAMRSVSVARIVTDERPPVPRFAPGHPDADADGFVLFPRVNVVEELTNMMSASRSFDANVLILRKARQMSDALHQIGR
jgi:flagellar basal-body rod protein FlgC